MKNIVLFLILGVLVIVAVVFVKNKSMMSDGDEVSSSPLTTEGSVEASPDINTDLRIGGSSYMDPEGVFTLLYPNDYTLDTQDSVHPRIYKQGEQQRPQSEMSDGIMIVFETIDLQGKSLEEFVDQRITEATADGTSEVIQAKQATILNGYPAFSYEVRGLGTARYLALQKSPQSNYAVVITYSISDPQQKNYQQEVDAIMSTVEMLK